MAARLVLLANQAELELAANESGDVGHGSFSLFGSGHLYRLTARVSTAKYYGSCFWRDGRVAEGARLESVFRLIPNVGSNPTLSAINPSEITGFL